MKRRFSCQIKLFSSIKNENGFVFPLSLAVLFLFSLLVMIASSEYISEVRYFRSLIMMNETETLFYFGLRDSIEAYEEDITDEPVHFLYDLGYVELQVLENDNELTTFSIQVNHYDGGKLKAEVFYNKIEKKIERIEEKFN